jgi:peptidyl-prolyl cis-trans isomerase A (cyclophilin A)
MLYPDLCCEEPSLNRYRARPTTLKLHQLIFLAFAFTLPLPAQTPTPAPASSTLPDLPDAPNAAANIVPPAIPTGPTAVIDTTMGRMTCQLFSKEAPITVDNFIGLAQGTKPWIDPVTQKKQRTHFYDGLTFHRVIPEFMIQGGDPAGNGTGDPGYLFQDEIDPSLTFDVPGRLAMANSGPGPTGGGTNGSQFFITEVPVPTLNGKHTIFGQCDPHSVLIAASIARVDRNAQDKPITPVVINKVTIVQPGQPMPPLPAPPQTPASN